MEAVRVAPEVRAGGAYAHSNIMLAAASEEQGEPEGTAWAPPDAQSG